MWAKMGPHTDLVNGYKISRADPFHRIVIGRVYHYIVSVLFGRAHQRNDGGAVERELPNRLRSQDEQRFRLRGGCAEMSWPRRCGLRQASGLGGFGSGCQSRFSVCGANTANGRPTL